MTLAKLKNFLLQKEKLILWLMIIGYFLVFSLICLWKYFNFGYNGLDLAIFNQVFYNSTNGHLFGFTIHPQSYLGDHFELIIVLLLPFYYLLQHPVSLLILQSLVLALCAWPLYLIAKRVLSGSFLSLFIVLAWLLCPFVQNINLFEFHILPFAMFFLFWAFYFYQKNCFSYFLPFCFLALLVREDVALVIFMFAVLALIEKRGFKWMIWPAAIAIVWFILATFITAKLSPSGSYKFLYYYSWLGGNLNEMLVNFFSKPMLVLSHFFTLNNLFFIVALMLPFCFIIFSWRYLILGLLVFIQLTLGGSNNSGIILKTHYVSLLLPPLFIAYIYGLSGMQNFSLIKSKVKLYLKQERFLLITLLTSAVVYGFLTFGPAIWVVEYLFKPVYSPEIKNLKTKFYQSVPAQASVAASYEFLTPLSSRPRLYSLHYAYIGKKQFSSLDYALPQDTQVLLFDFNDMLTYSIQFPNSQQWKQYYPMGDNNFRKLIKDGNYQTTAVTDTLVRMDKNASADKVLYQIAENFSDVSYPKQVNFDNGLTFLGWSPDSEQQTTNHEQQLLPLSLYFQTGKKLIKDYQLNLIIKNKNGQVVQQKYYPLAYGLYPTSEWQVGEKIKMNYWFLIPQKIATTDYTIELQLVYLEGFLKLNGLRTAVPEITKITALEPTIELNR